MQALGRLLIGALFIVSGIRKYLAFGGSLAYMQGKGFPVNEIAGYPVVQLLLIGTIALEVVGGLMLITGIGARFAAIVLALFTLAAGVIFHNFWTIDDPAQFGNQLNHFLKNIAIVGGLLFVAGHARPTVRTHL
jgi:putative oxidoreductase